MEKLSPNRAQLFVRNKYTVFTMGGTVTLRSVNKKFFGELQFCSYIHDYYGLIDFHMFYSKNISELFIQNIYDTLLFSIEEYTIGNWSYSP